MPLYYLTFYTDIPRPIDETWDFFANPKNLEKLTPPSLDFKIVNPIPETMYEGLLIQYRVKPLWSVPLSWLTEITHCRTPHYFIDEQRHGPYRIWHHEHHFCQTTDSTTRMTDKLTYQIGYGILDPIINRIIVRKEILKIFSYREKAIQELLPPR